MKKKNKNPFAKKDSDERDEKDEDERDDEREEKSMAVKNDREMRKAIALLNDETDDTDEGGAEERPTLLASLVKGFKSMGTITERLLKAEVGEDTTAYLHDGGMEEGFHNPKDSKGAKNKRKVATHEAAEMTDEEEADREDDEEDADSMTVRSPSGPGGADGGTQPTKRTHRSGLPDGTFGLQRSRRGEEDGDGEVSKSEEEMMEELASNENFAEVVEASNALEHLTNVMVKGFAMLSEQNGRLRKSNKMMRKSLQAHSVILKGIMTGDIEKALVSLGSKESESEGGEPVRKSGSRGGRSETSPGVIAYVDGKEVRVSMPGGTNIGKSKGTYTPEYIADMRERLIEGMNKGIIDAELPMHLDSMGPEFIIKSLSGEQQKQLGIKPLNS